jgi:hypothetical protein
VRLDAAALRALIELSDAKMPPPDRNPNRMGHDAVRNHSLVDERV